MMVDLSKLIYDKMVGQQFIMSVMGNMNQHLLKSFFHTIEQKLDNYVSDDCMKKKIFHFMVECAHNVCRVSDKEQNNQDWMFLIRKTENQYMIYLASVFKNEYANRIVNILEAANNQVPDEMKNHLYFEFSKHAAEFQNDLVLSMLDISKSKKENISYELSTVDNSHQFLAFKTVIYN